MMGGSAPRCINVSETTYELVRADFEAIDRGARFVKGKGMMRQYFITGGASFTGARRDTRTFWEPAFHNNRG